MRIPLIFRHLIGLGMVGTFGTAAHADVIINQFNNAAEVTQWRFDFGGVTHAELFSTDDANSNALSGSLKVTLNFPAANADHKGAYTRDAFFPGVNGSLFTTLQFDLKVDPNSALDAFGNNGFFSMALRNTDNYNYISQFGDNIRIDAGWRHVSVPLTGPYDAIRALTFQLYGGPSQNLGGPVTLYLDNVFFTEVPEPSSIALLLAGGLAIWICRKQSCQPRLAFLKRKRP
jgi:hypothetical protein